MQRFRLTEDEFFPLARAFRGDLERIPGLSLLSCHWGGRRGGLGFAAFQLIEVEGQGPSDDLDVLMGIGRDIARVILARSADYPSTLYEGGGNVEMNLYSQDGETVLLRENDITSPVNGKVGADSMAGIRELEL
ncbi:MAG: hypothetical protein ACK5LN_14995 [Propioniciclava sp.]